MSDDNLRPLRFDPAAAEVERMFDLDAGEWLYSAAGDYQTACVEAWKNDGSNHQTLIALTWPARKRGTNESVLLQLLIHPEDAAGLAENLAHSAEWLRAARQIGN